MDDRELLELAAKAAGMVGGWGEIVDIGGDKIDLTDMWFLEPDSAIWDPLTDDGDALRLAVKLKFTIEIQPDNRSVVSLSNFALRIRVANSSAHSAEENLRRAIVRAAAEIGKATP